MKIKLLYLFLESETIKEWITMGSEEEEKIIEAMEQLRISYNLRQWKVCSLICESLAEKFKSMAERLSEK